MDLKSGNEKKKQRRLPLFDITLLLLIALAVIGGAYWATHRAETPAEEILYTVRFSGVDNSYSGALAEGKVLYSVSGVAMGTIEHASVTRAKELSFDGSVSLAEGESYRYTETRSSEKSDIVVTVRVTAEPKNGGYFVGSNRIAAGMEVDAMVTGYLGNGLILTVEPSDVRQGSADVSVSAETEP